MGLMRRVLSLVVMLVILFGGATACGLSSKSTQAATSTSQAASASATQSASPSSATCASAGTRKIPKTRLLADLA